MPETTYSHARAHFASLCSDVAASREPLIIHRRKAEDVALVSAAELRSLQETAHLLRSPKNAVRLIQALTRARKRRPEGKSTAALRRELGLEA
ncbi:MAG: prevent-host-death protein [Elusimicrobia bacterium CG1_02_63_36]|nr:MAG: prevent-host-death protein [Elusimicrobia bacterium CG1_02_63_36]PIP82737.1 MAG: prevent-host-death protein [Elusimicrobia bacterium CG22_combo_CG10-13_8_21_14_all_63_91]PJA11980.1 MAG: prevent-host-death protein [Elusimicrobia bacterium CG_4_10_14_0_2_um_filter_63_34]PJB23775.1 MAG: prevent-host-death protein [Elusimicrobia bacterium CG_4_9_14_3_um_filter_62_55]